MKFLAEALTSTTGPVGTRQPGRARPGARRPHLPCPRSAQRCDDRMGTGEQYWPVTSARGAAPNRPLPAHVHSITSHQPLPGRHHRRTQQPPPYHPQQPHIPTPQEANTQLITTIRDANATRNCSRRLPVTRPERLPGASRRSVGDRRAPGSPTRTPGPRDESPAGGGFGPIPTPITTPCPGDRIAIHVVTGGRRWDPLTACTDAVTLRAGGHRGPRR